MYALRRGIGGLSSGTRVTLLSAPNVNPVRVRTLTAIPKYQHRRWVDGNGQKHNESVFVGKAHVEEAVPMDMLVKLREMTR